MDIKNNIPLVSIGLMIYKRPHYLRGVVDCWLNQTFKDFELIISNDDPSDGESHEICLEYAKKDKRIRYFHQEKNLNAPGCYKFVLKQARGKYFIWASDDDLWDKRFLELCLQKFKEDQELIMVFADMVDIDRNEKIIAHPDPKKYMPLARDTYKRLKQYTLFHFNTDGKIQLLFGLWKREIILDEPLFGPNKKNDYYPFYWGFDPYFISRQLVKGPVGFLPQTLFFRRSRVIEEYLPPRPLIPRLAVTFYYRLKRIFRTPYFWYEIRFVLGAKQLFLGQRLKLIFWNFYVMARLFFVRKI